MHILAVSSFVFHLHLTKLIIFLLSHTPLVLHKLLRWPYLLQASLVTFQQSVVTRVTELLRTSAFNAWGNYIKQTMSYEVKTGDKNKGKFRSQEDCIKANFNRESRNDLPISGAKQAKNKPKPNKTKTALWFLQDLEYTAGGDWCSKYWANEQMVGF